MSLHNRRQFLPAADLKEDLLRQRAWDDEGSGGRTFLQMLINREKGYNVPPFGRPEPVVPEPAQDESRIPDTAVPADPAQPGSATP
jgi:hypothetical protein